LWYRVNSLRLLVVKNDNTKKMSGIFVKRRKGKKRGKGNNSNWLGRGRGQENEDHHHHARFLGKIERTGNRREQRKATEGRYALAGKKRRSAPPLHHQPPPTKRW